MIQHYEHINENGKDQMPNISKDISILSDKYKDFVFIAIHKKDTIVDLLKMRRTR